jgi:epoxyqueuosine reductase
MNAEEIRNFARTLGFTLTGVARIEPTPEGNFYSEWLDRGYAGEMHYLERQKAARMDPGSVLPGARSVIVCAINYNTDHPLTSHDPSRAWISRYAWGRDYHDTLIEKLRELARWIESRGAGPTRTYVDTGPLTERVFAKYAGIGWFGKNTCIINQQMGSWLFLGCILTDLELAPDTPPPDRCGSCTRCLDACPTDAFVAPYVLDSRKCISYTRSNCAVRSPKRRARGLDIISSAATSARTSAPWNRRAPLSEDAAFQPKQNLMWPELDTLLEWSDEEWTRAIRGTPLKRAKVRGLLRNLMVVAGNSGLKRLMPRLQRFLSHEDEHVRTHATWASEKLSK